MNTRKRPLNQAPKVISISDVRNKSVFHEIDGHIVTLINGVVKQWKAEIISKLSFQQNMQRIQKLGNLLMYESVFEILYYISTGLLKAKNVDIHKCRNTTFEGFPCNYVLLIYAT